MSTIAADTAPGAPRHSQQTYHDDHDIQTQFHQTASVSSQLAAWHANRGDRSFVSAMIPRWHSESDGERVTRNPFKLIRMVSLYPGWVMFFSGWFAWTCDGYDYFAVSLTLTLLAEQFEVEKPKITTAITLTLLFRSLGALVFGVLADRFGRKWTLVVNLCLIAVLELGSGFVNTYSQFLGVRYVISPTPLLHSLTL